MAAVLADMDDDIEWQQAQGLPHGGVYHGVAEVRANIFDPLDRDWWSEFTAVPDEFLDAGDEVVVLGRYRGTAKQTGKTARRPVRPRLVAPRRKGVAVQAVSRHRRLGRSALRRELNQPPAVDMSPNRWFTPPTHSVHGRPATQQSPAARRHSPCTPPRRNIGMKRRGGIMLASAVTVAAALASTAGAGSTCRGLEPGNQLQQHAQDRHRGPVHGRRGLPRQRAAQLGEVRGQDAGPEVRPQDHARHG